MSVYFLCLRRHSAENSAKSRVKITALQLPDHMETMIVPLKSIYSTGPLLNVVYCGRTYALALESAPLLEGNHSQIIHCTHDFWHVVMCLSCPSAARRMKSENGLAALHIKYLCDSCFCSSVVGHVCKLPKDITCY